MTAFVKPLAFVLLGLFAALPARAEVDIQEVKSPGGLTAWLSEEPSIPFVALELRFRGGTALDAPGQRGAVNMMTGLLEEGAGDMDARAFAEAKESLAATFSYRASTDVISVSARFLTENQDAAIALLRESLIAPRFDEDAISRVRAQILSGLRSDETDPDVIAGRAFDAQMFGTDHPYGTDGSGTVESVAALTRDDLLEAKADTMALDRVYISAAGDISAEELAGLMDDLLAGLPETGAPFPADLEVQSTAGVTVVPFDTPQSVALFGHVGIALDDPDFFPTYVMNVVLGAGGFEARLMNEVREKRGLTYGVYTYLATRDHANVITGRVASANNRIAEAIDVIKAEWAKMAENGVTQDELDRAKTYLTGAYPLRFDGNGAIADILVAMQMDDFPIDYVETRNAKIEAVTLEDVRAAAARVLKPDQLHFVVVGQPEGLVDAPVQ